MKPLTHTLTLAIAALGLVGAANSPALANPNEPMTVQVTLADLDLATPEGQRALDKRLENAVRTVCQVASPSTGTRLMNHETRTCLVKARASVRDQLAALGADQQRGA